MKQLKTYDTLQKVKTLLEKTDIVKVKDFEIILNQNQLHSMNFYYFVYAGCFTKIQRGIYKKTDNFYLKTIPEIYRISTDILLAKRETRKNLKNNPIVLSLNLKTEKQNKMENNKIKIEIRKETFLTGKVKYWIYMDNICQELAYTEEEAVDKFNDLVKKTQSPSIEVIKSIEI